MTEEELKKLRKHYHALLELQRTLQEDPQLSKLSAITSPSLIRQLEQLSKSAAADFPQLITPFRPADYFMLGSYFDRMGILSYLALEIGKLKIEIEQTDSRPITQVKDFSFVANMELRRILERDYEELQKAFVARCWKSVIILSGGAIEAILTDLLLNNQTIALASPKASKKGDIAGWDLADLINVAVDTKLITPGVESLSHSVRDFRNLVHPGNEIRNKLKFDAEEAKIALTVLDIVHRELSI